MIIGPDGDSSATQTLATAPPPPPPARTASSNGSATAVAPSPDSIDTKSSSGAPASPTLLDAAGRVHASPGDSDASSSPFTPLGSADGALKGAAAGDPTQWFPQGPLPPYAKQVDGNGNLYQSDRFGRPQSASGDLQLTPGPRSPEGKAAQLAAGGNDRLSTDEGGHLIAHSQGGAEDAWNLVPQDGNLNKGAYKAGPSGENGFKSALARGDDVNVDVRGVYDQPTLRPTNIVRNSSVNGVPNEQQVFANKANTPPVSELGDVGKGERFYNGLADVSEGLETVGKVAAPLAVAGDALSIYNGFKADGDTIGTHTVQATGSAVGGWVGAAEGAEFGAELGSAAGPVGTVVGGLVGGVAGGIIGSGAGDEIAKAGEQVASDAWSAGKSAVHSIGSAASSVAHFFGF